MKIFSAAIFIAVIATQTLAQERPNRFRTVPRASVVEGIRPCGTDICTTTQPRSCIEVSYGETAWRTCISNQGRRGLVLGPTDLRRTPAGEWMRILREASVGEIFVPYHGLPLRLYDHETTSAASIVEVNTTDTGRDGTLVTLTGQSRPQVVAEMNDRGIAWLCKDPNGKSISRRGQELVLWGVQDAANYDFIIEYRLRDDGSIGFRLGATGFNNPYFPPRSTTEPHMHDVLWRIDVDLNGSGGDSAVQFKHIENDSETRDVEETFNSGREGVAVWDPATFYTIGVVDSLMNSYGSHIGYSMRIGAPGLSRHYGSSSAGQRRERFTQSDFGVTTFKQSERDAHFDTPHRRYLQPDQYLLGDGFPGMGIADAESVEDTDIILWHRSSAHHHPHDEDHAPGDPADLMTGITGVHWQGVDLEPHNLFDYNPLGGPNRDQCR